MYAVGTDKYITMDPLSRCQLHTGFEVAVHINHLLARANFNKFIDRRGMKNSLKVPTVYN